MSGRAIENEMKRFQEPKYPKEKRGRKEWWQDDGQIMKFYKLFYTWNKDRDGMLIAYGLLVIFLMIFAMIPLQELMEDMDDLRLCVSMNVALATLTPSLYIDPYVSFREEGKGYGFARRLQYLPVDIRKLQKLQFLYSVKFIAKIFGAALVLQMLFSLLICHGISWKNICYIGAIFFLLPLGINVLIFMTNAQVRGRR